MRAHIRCRSHSCCRGDGKHTVKSLLSVCRSVDEMFTVGMVKLDKIVVSRKGAVESNRLEAAGT